MKTKQIIIIIAIVLVIALIAGLCYGYYGKFVKKIQNPVAKMEVEGYGIVTIELYPEIAPNTVSNFIRLANRGFYDGLTFHRVIKDFMIQGGDPEGNGTGGPTLGDIIDDATDDEYAIEGEFVANGYTKNTLRHTEGIISMARSDYSAYGYVEEGYNSAGSQFFIVTKNSPSLNGLYAAFGKVTDGIDVVHAIENIDVDEEDGQTPVSAPVITSLRVDTYGVDYSIPKIIEPFDLSSLFSY